MSRLSDALRGLPLARIGAFGALAAFAALRWSALLRDPPVARLLAATLVLVALAALLARLGRVGDRRLRLVAAAGAALLGLALAALVLGIPARLLLPRGWGELVSDLGGGLDMAAGAGYPLPVGGDGWAQLTIMLGLLLAVWAAALIAFWPAREAGPARGITALAILCGAYGVAATLVHPPAPLLQGLLLFAMIAAWLWLPGMTRRNGVVAAGLIVAAGLAALPLSAGATGRKPLLDYTHWDFSSSGAGGTEFFSWNHDYGPLGWPRRGHRLMVVSSAEPHYWRTAVLDRFDGFRWLEPIDRPPARLQLPSLFAGPASAAYLDNRWVHTARFQIDELSSQLVPAAGTPLSVQGLGETSPSDGGIVPADGNGVSNGDTYVVHYYSPQPSPQEMRRASSVPYPAELRRYTTLALPERSPGTVEAQNGNEVPVVGVTKPLSVPLRSSESPASVSATAGRLLRSPYSRVYRLARRITASSADTYDAVEAINRQMLGAYSYNENPPVRHYPLRAFLFRDRQGYCQQFSGAMALMLRMLGIPSRVASGFSPGSPSGSGKRFVVHDFDAHSWVEVYFEQIGWVPFDPTPGTAPAASTSPGPTLPVLRTRRRAPEIQAGRSPALAAPSADSGTGSGGEWAALGAGAGAALALVIAGGALAAVARRRRSLGGEALAEAQIAELRRALPALGRPIAPGLTLRRLERDSAALGRPGLAAYAAKLGAFRYGVAVRPPEPEERRRMRQELGGHRGLRVLRALRAVPPLGPKPVP